MSNTALITITEGVATAKQVENEFKLKAGPASTWRWYAKKVDDNKFQMSFPNSKTIEDIAYFTEMRMRSLTSVVFKVEKWNSAFVSKGPLVLLGSRSRVYHMRKGPSPMCAWLPQRLEFP